MLPLKSPLSLKERGLTCSEQAGNKLVGGDPGNSVPGNEQNLLRVSPVLGVKFQTLFHLILITVLGIFIIVPIKKKHKLLILE